ncbi:MAG TPA: undecaprenyl-diphosphate phosphatase, partial [Arenibaculum sp.]|nr:undecaprenyl-diphosphate phosphatase [Arenibaculum sp.]
MGIDILLGLALVQGITEFLPVSSSGHLILISRITGWPDQGLSIDIALHVGTLGAVVAYFWRDSLAMTRGGFDLLRGRDTSARRLALLVAIATVPVVVAGLLLHGLIANALRSG